jgi:hypothetical protein
MVKKFAASIVDTGGQFGTGVVDTGGAPWLANISVNFRKNLNDPHGILWGWGETDTVPLRFHGKNYYKDKSRTPSR